MNLWVQIRTKECVQNFIKEQHCWSYFGPILAFSVHFGVFYVKSNCSILLKTLIVLLCPDEIGQTYKSNIFQF